MATASLNEFQVSGPDWAKGCEGCQFGLAVAPEIVTMLQLHEQRAVQMDEGLIEFCDCRAGFMYRQYLRKVFNAMSMETKKNVRHFVLAAIVPTVRYESEAA